jgi:hypothetical protein
MSESEPRTVHFDGVRIRYDSTTSFGDVVAALEDDVGDLPVAPSTTAAGSRKRVSIAGLFAPVELLIVGEGTGGSSVTYVQPPRRWPPGRTRLCSSPHASSTRSWQRWSALSRDRRRSVP